MFREVLLAGVLALTPAAAVDVEPARGYPVVSGVVVSKWYEAATRPHGVVGRLTGPECWGLEIAPDSGVFNRNVCTHEATWRGADLQEHVVAPEVRHAWWRHFS